MGAYVKKSVNNLFWLMDKVDKKHYLKLYPHYLKWLGIQIDSENVAGTWISPTTSFDSSKYNYIEIGKAVTISFGVSILVHDFSIVHAARSIGKKTNAIIYKRVKSGNNVALTKDVYILAHDASMKKLLGKTKVGKVQIGNNVFVGAKTVILPGVSIGDNVVIAANSSVTKSVPSNEVWGGGTSSIYYDYA